MKLVTAEMATEMPVGAREDRPMEWVVISHWADYPQKGMPLGMSGDKSTIAFVSQGRWVADCATPECGVALIVTPIDPRFFCPVCGNDSAGGRWLKVQFPNKTEFAQVEGILGVRQPQNAHYHPQLGETIEQLAEENEANGLPRILPPTKTKKVTKPRPPGAAE